MVLSTVPGHELIGQMDVYDLNPDTWILSATLVPHGTDRAGWGLGYFACGLGSFLYCLGGTETMDRYSRLLPASRGFSTDGVTREYVDNPDPRCYTEVVAIGSLLCIVGGVRRSLTDYAETMSLYNTRHQLWRSPVSLPYAAHGQGACSWHGVLYVFTAALAGGIFAKRTWTDGTGIPRWTRRTLPHASIGPKRVHPGPTTFLP